MGTNAVSFGTKAVEIFNEYNTDKTNAKMAEILAAGFAVNAAYKLLIEGKKFSGVTNGLASAGLYRARLGFQHRTFDEENATYHAHNKSLQKSIRELTEIAKDVGNLTEEQRQQLGRQVQEYQTTLEKCRADLEKCRADLEERREKLAVLDVKLETTTKRVDERIALLASDLVKSASAIVEISKQVQLSLKSTEDPTTDISSIIRNVELLTGVIKNIEAQLKAAANFEEAKK